MAVSIIERPYGVILGACVSATIDEDYSGYATVNKTSHGLSDGQYVYIQSNVEDYNGFWPVEVIDGHLFFILQYPDGPRVAFKVNATITYCPEESTHTWSCVHLPISYKLSSNRWPINSVDTARTVSSFSDDNGYTNLNLSGALKSTVFDLDYVKISGAADDDLNGVFQIKDAVSTSDVTIDLVYDSGYSFAGATVQFYYNNYHINVRVYGGLTASHPYVAFKPYELLGTFKFIPDSSGQVKFSVSEFLKSQITTRNGLTLATLPNNIDFYTQFYISTAEAFDESDGTTITVDTSAYTSDQSNFEGYAANAKLPFKNQHSGFLTDYTTGYGNEAQWLTLFDSPVFVEGKYFDIGLINNIYDTIRLLVTHKLNGSTLGTETTVFTDIGKGLLRLPIAYTPTGDQMCIKAFIDEDAAAISLPALATWSTRSTSGTLEDWLTGVTPDVTLAGGISDPESSEILYTSYAFVPGRLYVITVNYTLSAGGTLSNFNLYIMNDAYEVQFSDQNSLQGNGSYSIDVSFTATQLCTKVGVSGTVAAQQGITIEITSATSTEEIPLTYITEELCIDVEDECSNQSIYLTWLNYLGNFEYWDFTAQKEYQIDVTSVEGSTENIFPSWPNSYGSFADTIDKDVLRTSRNQIVVRSQYVTLAQLNAIKYIRTSPLVQIVTSQQDRRTVRVDQDSFKVYDEGEKMFTISFTISYTDEIPSQSV
jgi:hypothetical protein